MQHDWVTSKLGHGETMCSRCFITNREAAALGVSNSCTVSPPVPSPVNDNELSHEVSDEYLDTLDDGPEPGEECGRWSNGRLSRYCMKAGTEECDFECPYRDNEAVSC